MYVCVKVYKWENIPKVLKTSAERGIRLRKEKVLKYSSDMIEKCEDIYKVDLDLYDEYQIKRGLRDKRGNSLHVGISYISRMDSYEMKDGVQVPCDGKLLYRGYDVRRLIQGFTQEKRFGFEESVYLLLFGKLPNKDELREFEEVMAELRVLPEYFIRDVIMKAPGKDIMNTMTKSVLNLAAYDDRADDLSLDNVLRQCIMLIGQLPMIAVYGYQAYRHYRMDENLYIHRPDKNLSMAENILRMLRPDMKYTELEAKVLDIALILHMENGGGNNSTFTTRVVTSAGSDTYSVIAAALCSLKGIKHGGANVKVEEMFDDLKETVTDIHDEAQICDYLEKLLDKEAFDRTGMIYGMGHPVYSISDPRSMVFRGFVEKLAEEKGRKEEFELYKTVERLAPQVIGKKRKIYKGVSANIDFYSGFVCSMLNIPRELYTPLFAMGRMVGWSAHRMEELISGDKIIRPGYVTLVDDQEYVPLEER